jgi:hypothetical protein
MLSRKRAAEKAEAAAAAKDASGTSLLMRLFESSWFDAFLALT